jgi:phosphoserine phosphatase
VTYREGKLEAVMAWIGRAPTFAAGDSEGDQWLLRAARHALLVDRGAHGDPALRALAREEGWWVQTGWS